MPFAVALPVINRGMAIAETRIEVSRCLIRSLLVGTFVWHFRNPTGSPRNPTARLRKPFPIEPVPDQAVGQTASLWRFPLLRGCDVNTGVHRLRAKMLRFVFGPAYGVGRPGTERGSPDPRLRRWREMTNHGRVGASMIPMPSFGDPDPWRSSLCDRPFAISSRAGKSRRPIVDPATGEIK